MTALNPNHENSDRPPLFKTWPRMYAFVLSFLALLVVAFYFFGRIFS
jgi:uncharacterized membrane protein